VVNVGVVVVLVVEHPPVRHESQQLVADAWQALPSPRAVQDAASDTISHFVPLPGDVRQHGTAPGRPHVDFETQPITRERHADGSDPSSTAAPAIARAQST
jgi:hypothetical protein